MRYSVRLAHSESGPTLYRVYDGGLRVFVETFTREPLAEACARRLQRDHDRRLSRVPELVR